jgi:diguanylate cyclase (GGDEF)-like protein
MGDLEIVHELSHHAPGVGIIAMLNHDNHRLIETLLTSGAQDYLIKEQWDKALLRRVMRYVVARQKSHAEIERLAHYDALTGVANRYLFNDRLSQAVIRAERSKSQIAVLFLDLDHFHGVNESLGYDTGDKLLVEAAQRISSCIRKQDTIARLGSDEFAVVLEGINEPQHVMIITRQILKTFDEPTIVNDEPIFVSLSIGISISSSDLLDAPVLIKQADIARYRAKEAGRNTFEFFSPEYNRMVEQRLSIEQTVNQTLDRIFHSPKKPPDNDSP